MKTCEQSAELPPLDTRHLFFPLSLKLLNLLKGLPTDKWLSATCYPSWRVKEIAAHLLQTAANRLSRQRDDYLPDEQQTIPLLSFTELVPLIAAGNTAWEKTFAVLSPRLILTLLKPVETELARFIRTLPLSGKALYSVSWAGEKESDNWFDIAREYTERWHHQQQIRDAVGAPSLETPKYMKPVIATLVRCLPFWYKQVPGLQGVRVQITITGPCGGHWTLKKEQQGWELHALDQARNPEAHIELDTSTAWRHFTRTRSPEHSAQTIACEGPAHLTRPFLEARAIMM